MSLHTHEINEAETVAWLKFRRKHAAAFAALSECGIMESMLRSTFESGFADGAIFAQDRAFAAVDRILDGNGNGRKQQ